MIVFKTAYRLYAGRKKKPLTLDLLMTEISEQRKHKLAMSINYRVG